MNRISRESPAGPRSIAAGSQHRRGHSIAGDSGDQEEKLDLFSRTRHSLPIASHGEADVLKKLGRISLGSSKPVRSGIEDLLSSVDGGKHDYDWLLTPPETPLCNSSDASRTQVSLTAQRSSSSVRSISNTKPSRLSVSHSESSYSTRPTRSSSVTRSSTYNIHSTYSSNTNRTSVLNTSTASVTSSRPSTPTSRANTGRSSVPTSRPTSARSSTPAKTRPASITSTDKTRPSLNPRPSTPTSRQQVPGNSTFSASNSRPSTPARRNPVPAASVPVRSSSVGRIPLGRSTAPSSRASSPSPKTRPPPQPIVPPDFPLEAPPNLRTTLPNRPVSAGRSRPGAAVTVRSSSEPAGPVNPSRRHSSPITRGRLPELSKGIHGHGNRNEASPPSVPKHVVSRPVKPVSTTESTGFGRTISKKSIDMALRHMDIRQSGAGIRGLTSNSLFPQSIRSSAPKGRPARVTDSPSSIGSSNSDNGNGTVRSPNYDHETNVDSARLMTKLNLEPDIYESSRYDTMLLKEDMKSTNWLLSVEDKCDQSPLFDHRFEPLPEPFGFL